MIIVICPKVNTNLRLKNLLLMLENFKCLYNLPWHIREKGLGDRPPSILSFKITKVLDLIFLPLYHSKVEQGGNWD